MCEIYSELQVCVTVRRGSYKCYSMRLNVDLITLAFERKYVKGIFEAL